MIFYFSGTGNSKWVAEELEKGTKDKKINIVDIIKNKIEMPKLEDEEKIGLVFPIHAWRAPSIFMDFLKTLKVGSDSYIYVVCTCGEETGLAIKKVDEIIKLNSAYSVIMPNNYIFGFDVDPVNVEKEKLEKAKRVMPEIIENINSKLKIFDENVGTMAGIKSNFTYLLFNKYGKSTKKFFVQDNCTSCGKCEEVCPVSCIKLEKGRPVWANNCIACSACINYCPEKAVQFGAATVNKGRYYFKD